MENKRVQTIGIVLETMADAEEFSKKGLINDNQLRHYYHWREPNEVAAIRQAIEKLGYDAVIVGTPAQLLENLPHWKQQIDFIFNLSVGFITRYRMAQGPAVYELAGLPYSGADPFTKMVSQNKHLLKACFDKMGISTPPWVLINQYTSLKELQLPPFPVMVKPAHEGSSVGIDAGSKVHDFPSFKQRVAYVLEELNMPVLVEQFINGREVKVGFIGNEVVKFTGIIEDVAENNAALGDRFLYFNAKKDGFFEKVKRDIDDSQFGEIVSDCHRIYRHFLPVDYASFDIRIDNKGQHYFLEFQADATLHPERTLAQICAQNGVSFDAMIQMILESALEKYGLAEAQIR